MWSYDSKLIENDRLTRLQPRRHVLLVPLIHLRRRLGAPASQTADVKLGSSKAQVVVALVLRAPTRMESELGFAQSAQ
jgi:hypothetical protein